MYKQLIVARKDLNMSPGKLAAQVSHGSMAFLTWMVRNNIEKWTIEEECIKSVHYKVKFWLDKDLYEQWINGAFTKVVCEARNKNNLLRAVEIAKSLGLQEGVHYFLIRDNCLTELEPEDEDGRTLTCIGFAPMDNKIVEQISKKFQLYR